MAKREHYVGIAIGFGIAALFAATSHGPMLCWIGMIVAAGLASAARKW